MLWRPPLWADSVASLWRIQAGFAIGAAATEAGIGFWLRKIPTLAQAPREGIWLWIGGLGGWLGLRVVLAWRRDLVRETAALASGAQFHRRLWAASEHPPVTEGNSWLAREGREGIEAGTRAAAEMRTAIITLAVILPLLLGLAPWLALAVAACALALGMVARRRSEAGKRLADAEGHDSRHNAETEDWAWRAMPEAAASGIGSLVVARLGDYGQTLSQHRLKRSRSLLAWGAIGETAAHGGGWILAAVSLVAWKTGWLPAGNLTAFLGLALLAYRPVREAGRHLPHLQKAQEVWGRLLQLEPLPQATSAPTTPSLVPPELILEGLEAGWDPALPLFQGLDLRLFAGEIAVAEGLNGCGKSTLLAALAQNCPHRSTRISLPTDRFWMAQEPVLPPLSPQEWIPTPNPRALALLFPQGLPSNLEWQSPLARGGHNLSRGQRARMALLAIASNPYGLWLLDEPLSALPADQRPSILRGLLELRGQAIVLLAEPVLPVGLTAIETLWQPAPSAVGPRLIKVGIA